MGQDSKTGGRGLYVETIEIDPEGGENVVFPCNAWSEEEMTSNLSEIFIHSQSTKANLNQVSNAEGAE